MFSFKYQQQTCLETCTLKTLLQKCGDVIPYWQKFVTEDLEKNKTNLSVKERRKCMKKYFTTGDLANCNCGLQCKEVSYTMKSYPYYALDFNQDYLGNATTWYFVIKRANDKVKKVTEKPAYTFSEFSADLGGHCGLLLGLSVMSLFEFLAFLIVCIAAYIKQRHQ